MDGEKFLVTVQQVGNSPLGDAYAAVDQVPVDLRDAAVRRVAQSPDQRDHIQAEGTARQRPPALVLRAIRLMVERTARILAAPHGQRQAGGLGQRANRARFVIGHP